MDCLIKKALSGVILTIVLFFSIDSFGRINPNAFIPNLSNRCSVPCPNADMGNGMMTLMQCYGPCEEPADTNGGRGDFDIADMCPAGSNWVGPMTSGRCEISCPDSTVPIVDLTQPGEPTIGCQCSNGVNIGSSGNTSLCDSEVNSGECVDPSSGASGGYSVSPAAQDEFERCQAAEIERERARNQAEAESQAAAAAQAELARNIESTRTEFSNTCNSQTQNFINECQNVSAQAPPNENVSQGQASSAEGCRSLQRSSESVVGQVEAQVQGCMNSYNSLVNSFCRETTGVLSGAGSASVGAGPTLAEASEEVSGSGDIPANSDAITQAQSINTNLGNLSTEISSEMRSLQQQAQECIAAFEQDPDNSEGGGLASLAQTAAQAFGKLDGSGGGAGAYDGEMGGGGQRSSAAQSTGFTGSGSSSFGGSSAAISEGGPAGFNGGGGDFDGSVSDGLNPSGPRSPASTNGPGQGNPGMGAMGMPIGGGVGRGAGNSGGAVNSSGSTNTRGKRNFASSDKRNLVLGYKKVNKDGQSVTFKQADLEKVGKVQMLAKLEEAKKKFGEDTPLLFKNGKFVRDYLEMKNRLAWQKYNLRQKNRMSGLFNSAKIQKAKSFHPCAEFGECYTEARYNIFKLHHFKAIKHINEKTGVTP